MTIFQLKLPINHLNKRQIGLNFLIIGVWLYLYLPLLDYFQIIFTREDFRTNQIILIGLILITVQRFQQQKRKSGIDAPPKLAILPLVICLGSSLLYLLVERFFDINTIAGTLFGFSAYGLIGLWLPRQNWKKGFPVALLFIGTLPFGAHMQTFIGYPMRILTAQIVQNGFQAFGVQSIGIDTILVFENGISHIDLPCSGVNSLWTGSLFFLGATWLDKRPLNRWWLFTGGIFVALLFLVNLARVAILILTGEVLGFHLFAEMLHVPLGVLGFVIACTAALFLLRIQTLSPNRLDSGAKARSFSQRESLYLAFFILILALSYTPRPQTGLLSDPAPWAFPASLEVEPMPLTAVENQWLTKDGAESAERFRFSYGDVQGSMILITSKTWRAHHRPERCFEVYGLELNESRTHLVSTTQPLRYVSLADDDQLNQYSASYWFQSSTQTTDDYATRIWSDLRTERERWVLVSIVFDHQIDPNDPQISAFYNDLHQITEQYLTSNS